MKRPEIYVQATLEGKQSQDFADDKQLKSII